LAHYCGSSKPARPAQGRPAVPMIFLLHSGLT
jgi:hypothetical protein